MQQDAILKNVPNKFQLIKIFKKDEFWHLFLMFNTAQAALSSQLIKQSSAFSS
jgi:hypothetical protein